jgi:hypothetical protein
MNTHGIKETLPGVVAKGAEIIDRPGRLIHGTKASTAMRNFNIHGFNGFIR